MNETYFIGKESVLCHIYQYHLWLYFYPFIPLYVFEVLESNIQLCTQLCKAVRFEQLWVTLSSKHTHVQTAFQSKSGKIIISRSARQCTDTISNQIARFNNATKQEPAIRLKMLGRSVAMAIVKGVLPIESFADIFHQTSTVYEQMHSNGCVVRQDVIG